MHHPPHTRAKDMHMRYPLVSVSAIVGAVLLVCHALGILTGSGHVAEYVAPDTGTSFPRWSDGTYACGEEDGSTPGQPFPCRWEAAEQGNGHGRTYTLDMPVCTLEQVAASDARHAAGLPPVPATCDDAESLIPN